MAFDKHVRRGHPVLFGLIIFLAIIEGSIATWLAVRFNQHHNYSSTSVRDRARFLAFVSWWTVFFSIWFLVLFLHSASSGSVLTSVGAHGIFLFITWILWTAGAASITAAIGGGYDCSNIEFDVPYCNQLNALMGFAWAIWLLIAIALIVVILRGISSARRGDGLKGQLVTA